MVNPAITAAIIAASHQEEVEKKIEKRLKEQGATGPSGAILLNLEGKDRDLLDQAVAGGTVKLTSDGRAYLNEQAVADRQEGQGFMALLILLVVASILVSAVALVKMVGN